MMAALRPSTPETFAWVMQERLSTKEQEQCEMLLATDTMISNLFMVEMSIVFIIAKIHKILELCTASRKI